MENLNYQTGWVCPKCGRVYSPTTPMCYFCSARPVTTTSFSSTEDVDWLKPQSATTTKTDMDDGGE